MKIKAVRGNFVSEWFGHRMYPAVISDAASIQDQSSERCPFISASKGETTSCIKAANSRGVCTINSFSDGVRQDWLVCPYRAMTPELLQRSARKLFSLAEGSKLTIKPAIALISEIDREEVVEALRSLQPVFIYFDAKLGGELSIPGTARSPEFSFDVTLVELVQSEAGPAVGRFGILEIQTMDFHGSYKTAVRNLQETLRMLPKDFAVTIQGNQGLLGEGVEGPNIANVFKRTFYQMMFKFQLGLHGRCAGCVLAIPASVWRSWQPHLGGVELTHIDGTRYELTKSGEVVGNAAPAWIFIFDTAPESIGTPSPLSITHEVATSVGALSHYALEVAPTEALSAIDSPGGMLSLLKRRISGIWPELGDSLVRMPESQAVTKRSQRRGKLGGAKRIE